MSGLKELLNDEQGFKSDAKEKLDQKAFEKSHKKNLLKSSSTVQEILDAVQLIINTKSMTGHVTVLDGGAHLAPPRRDVGL